MARNEEKAQSTLSRFRAAVNDIYNGPAVSRPYLATECDDVQEAEKWRRQILKEISKKVSQIQNSALGEFRIRDLNDEINKLMREKGHWQDRIVELGGPNYWKIGPKMLDREGKVVPGQRGYRYFGAARDLPGVRELFEAHAPVTEKKVRSQLMKKVDAQYYGYRDDDDGVLIPLEQAEERIAIQRIVAEHEAAIADGSLKRTAEDDMDDLYLAAKDGDEIRYTEVDEEFTQGIGRFVAHVAVPSQKEVEAYLLERKKEELLKRYANV
eukprot:CFRG1157T1